jgi:2-polyprenyl-3-methyl-5-hydroxy-6-metoxy-1,4-benzoquinol methylase
MNLDELQRNWDALGRSDPLWAIQFVPTKKGNRWDPEEFFRTGEQDVAGLETWLEGQGVALRNGRALDFGCGVGRLTQALAGRFDEVDGVDIAPSMIEQARRHNRHGERCRYHLNAAADLEIFGDGSFDLVCSLYVLQHVETDYARAYLREFLRVLRPGGVLVVGLPSHPAATLRGLLFAALPNRVLNPYRRLRYGCPGVMELHGLRRAEVVALLQAAGGEVAAVVEEPALGADWHAYRYCAVKRPDSTTAEQPAAPGGQPGPH